MSLSFGVNSVDLLAPQSSIINVLLGWNQNLEPLIRI